MSAPLTMRALAIFLLWVAFGCGGAAKEQAGQNTLGSPDAARPPLNRITGILPAWAIEDLQQALRARGYALPVSARFGRETEDALRAFQRDHELAPTGMPDVVTLRKLELEPLSIYEATLAE